jgi:NAD(P)-dependent dehydrogenase (short-subunit alcohol dehydrogenase family)
VVTGGNSGIGYQAAKELAVHGARVVLACRNVSSGEAAAQRITGAAPAGADVSTAEVDLSSIESVRRFAEKWNGPLDLLVNNAGVMAPPKLTESVDGFELQFATNHLGHYVLTGLLLPALVDAAESGRPSRVVTVSSIAHHGGTDAVIEANVGVLYHPQKTYSNSKLANLLFALQLNRELEARHLPVTSVAAHPGVSATGLFSNRDGMGAKPMMRMFAPIFLKALTQSPAAGARATLFAATEAEPGSYTGPQLLSETRGRIGPAKRSKPAQDEDLARRLWRVSEDLTGYRYSWPRSDGRSDDRPGD